MKVSVEKLPTSEAVVDVEISWDEMEKASDKAYHKLVRQVDIQGFRRGKAPRSLLERRLGKEYIYQEGLDDLITEAYRTALHDNEITPITQPKLDAPSFEMGQSYHCSLKVPIVTPVELGDYHSLHFEREEATVTSEEVDKEIESLRNRLATWTVVERPAQYDDRVTVDLKLTSGDQQISDLKDNPFELTQERPGIFSGMDEHIVGMKPGENKSFSTTIPEDYSNEKLAGKQADYTVTLHKIEEKHQPEIDDAFASEVSDGQFESMEDLSKAVSDNVLETKKRRIRDELREQALKAVIEQSQFTLHPMLIDEEVDSMLHQLSHAIEQQHMSMDQYLMLMRKSLEEYKQELRPDAENRVKRELVLDEIARKEDIKVQAEELEMLFNTYAQMGQPLPQNENQIRALAISFQREKVLTRLIELTTDPDPDEVSEDEAQEDDTTVVNARAAAQVGAEIEASAGQDEAASEETVDAASQPKDSTSTVE
ncbi:MAG TPA: trigger factor [Ktedonobacteraceae bacterium]